MNFFSRSFRAGTFVMSLVAVSLVTSGVAQGQSAVTPDPTDPGKAVFKRANCMGCHKWHGNGGGGYGGDALSLRKTELAREQIVETVGCGRPATGMPFFLRGAYDTIKCHDMLRQDVADNIPPEGATVLRQNDIDAVADYVLAHIKGKGEPTYDDCISFFSTDSRVCNIYKAEPTASPDGAGKGQ